MPVILVPEFLAFKSASEAAEAIRCREVTSQQLTRHMLNRIERFNPRLNAVVALMRDQALAMAAEADDALQNGIIFGLLHGVPVTVKDLHEIKGVATTCGSPLYADYIPESDSVLVQRLREAGAVILGHTNVPELAADWQSYNKIYGTTVNPWNPERVPGGSSGGCAASLAAGLSFLSVGSDFAGSIRVPAHFCGVYGHRPTVGVIPQRGAVPGSMGGVYRPPKRMSTPGPLARCPRDLALAMRVIGGPDVFEAKAYRWAMPEPRHGNLRDYRIGYVIDEPLCPSTGEVAKVHSEMIQRLSEAGANLEEGWPEGIDPGEQFHLFKLLRFMDKAAQLKDENLEETLEMAKRGDDEGLMAWVWTAPHKHHLAILDDWINARATWQRYFETYDVFLMPVDFIPAFPHDHSDPMTGRTVDTAEGPRRYMDQLFWMTFSSVTGLPCTTAPVGFTSDGLPVGVQIMGPYLEDGTTIRFAELLAEVVGGYREPKGFRM